MDCFLIVQSYWISNKRLHSRTTPNILRILLEPFQVPSSLFSGVSNESKIILSFVEPLSVFSYGSRMMQA
jgi:hypothetical protein